VKRNPGYDSDAAGYTLYAAQLVDLIQKDMVCADAEVIF
jgi:hypothetical protein